MSQYRLLQDKTKTFEQSIPPTQPENLNETHSSIEYGQYLTSTEMPMTYKKCPICNSPRISSMCRDCYPINYHCDACNWRYITHLHDPPAQKNSAIPNNVHMNSVISKAVRK